MNGAQAHLLMNHFPVLVPLISLFILAGGLIFRSPVTRQVGLWVMIAGALFSIPTYLTGEPAESVVKNYPGPTRDRIHRHEHAALPALIVVCVGGLMAGAMVFAHFQDWSVSPLTWAALFLLISVGFGMMARVAHLGGEVRHEEIEGIESLQPPL